MEGLSLLMAQLPAAFTVHQPPAGFFLSEEVQGSGGKTRIGQPDSAGGLRGGRFAGAVARRSSRKGRANVTTSPLRI